MKWGFSRNANTSPRRAVTGMDFDAILQAIDARGGFDDFADTPPAPFKTYPYPTYPGDKGYSCSPQQASAAGIPQALIKAKHDAAREGLDLYMPSSVQSRWMHAYFTTDFMNTTSFRDLLVYTRFLSVNSSYLLDNAFTEDYTQPERKGRTDRRIYTADEIRITQDICKQVPAIAISILAYQSVFLEYFAQLGDAIARTNLAPEKKERAAQVIKTMEVSWSSNNFLENLYPAIALHYAQRAVGTSDTAVTEQDFIQGMVFANRSGIFNRTVTDAVGEEKNFTCPAKGMINRTSGLVLNAPDTLTAEPLPTVSTMGTSLFHIYRIVDKKVKAGGHAINEVVGNTQSKLDDLIIPSYLARR